MQDMDDALSAALARDDAEMTKEAQLMRDGRSLHRDSVAASWPPG
jgi:hypothetical protein